MSSVKKVPANVPMIRGDRDDEPLFVRRSNERDGARRQKHALSDLTRWSYREGDWIGRKKEEARPWPKGCGAGAAFDVGAMNGIKTESATTNKYYTLRRYVARLEVLRWSWPTPIEEPTEDSVVELVQAGRFRRAERFQLVQRTPRRSDDRSLGERGSPELRDEGAIQPTSNRDS